MRPEDGFGLDLGMFPLRVLSSRWSRVAATVESGMDTLLLQDCWVTKATAPMPAGPALMQAPP